MSNPFSDFAFDDGDYTEGFSEDDPVFLEIENLDEIIHSDLDFDNDPLSSLGIDFYQDDEADDYEY